MDKFNCHAFQRTIYRVSVKCARHTCTFLYRVSVKCARQTCTFLYKLMCFLQQIMVYVWLIFFVCMCVIWLDSHLSLGCSNFDSGTHDIQLLLTSPVAKVSCCTEYIEQTYYQTGQSIHDEYFLQLKEKIIVWSNGNKVVYNWLAFKTNNRIRL